MGKLTKTLADQVVEDLQARITELERERLLRGVGSYPLTRFGKLQCDNDVRTVLAALEEAEAERDRLREALTAIAENRLTFESSPEEFARRALAEEPGGAT